MATRKKKAAGKKKSLPKKAATKKKSVGKKKSTVKKKSAVKKKSTLKKKLTGKKKSAVKKKPGTKRKPVPRKKTTAKKRSVASVYFIVNPLSAAGKTAKRWKNIEPLLSDYFSDWEVVFTEQPGHAGELAAQAIAGGAQKIIAVGGDGTNNEVAQGFFRNGKVVPTKAALGFIAAGTGSDFVRTIGIPAGDFDEQLAIIKNGQTLRIDTGIVEYAATGGGTEKRMFINIADAGLGGEVVRNVNASGSKGFLAYQFHTIKTMLTYKNKPVILHFDDESIQLTMNAVIVANGQYFGGGIKIAPDASLTDGLFDVVVMHTTSKLKMMLKLNSAKSGKHIDGEDLFIKRARKVVVESPIIPSLVDIDGEQPGQSPVTFTMIPKSLSIIVPTF